MTAISKPESTNSRGAEPLDLASRVLEMIARRCDLSEILGALCDSPVGGRCSHQVAFFLLDSDQWKLSASSLLMEPAPAILAGFDPQHVSSKLITSDFARFEGFCARQLSSGIGEVLGLFVCMNAGERTSASYDSVCRLAEIAIEQRNLLAELTWKADHDDVTGLLSRSRFESLMATQRLYRASAEASAALLCIDLDRFQVINAVLGHSLGNRVLRCVGNRLQSSLGTSVSLARLGGDEFAALVSASQAAAVADRLQSALSEALDIDDHEIFISASIGIAAAGPETSPESLQREAYIALYHAKRTAKGRWLFFNPSMAIVPPERLEMERSLRSALERNEIELHYQPQIDLRTGCICGAEALLRWNATGLGRIAPAAFIPILEETGLIFEFGRWAIRRACRDGVEWQTQTGQWRRIAVNVSAVQFGDPRFVTDVERILAETGFPNEFLELELTESLFVGDFASARSVFAALRKARITITIDDFGTGQSSLLYLQNLPFQRLKIDRSFIACTGEGKCPAIVDSILRMAFGLGLKVVAEGVETEEQYDALRALGCDEGQGFLFGHALPADEFHALCAVTAPNSGGPLLLSGPGQTTKTGETHAFLST